MTEPGMSRRVVVTSMGVVTAIGTTVADFWAGCRRGQLKDFDHKARLKNFKRDKIIQYADRYSWFAAAAADEAMRQSGLEVPFTDPYRTACIIGSGAGGLVTVEAAYRDLFI